MAKKMPLLILGFSSGVFSNSGLCFAKGTTAKPDAEVMWYTGAPVKDHKM